MFLMFEIKVKFDLLKAFAWKDKSFVNSGNVYKLESLRLKGSVHRFHMGGGVHGTVSSSEIRITLRGFNFFDPCGSYGRFYGVTDRPNTAVKHLK